MCSSDLDWHGISDVCMSVPTIVGCAGAGRRLELPLTPDELERLTASVERLREVAPKLHNTVSPKTFTDQNLISPWALEAVQIASGANANILAGYPDGSFRPQNTATRAETVVMILKALQLNTSCEGPMGPPGPPRASGEKLNWEILYYTVHADDWKLVGNKDGLNSHYIFDFKESKLTKFIYEKGLVKGFILEDEAHLSFIDGKLLVILSSDISSSDIDK